MRAHACDRSTGHIQTVVISPKLCLVLLGIRNILFVRAVGTLYCNLFIRMIFSHAFIIIIIIFVVGNLFRRLVCVIMLFQILLVWMQPRERKQRFVAVVFFE